MPGGMPVIAEKQGFLAWWQQELAGIFHARSAATPAKPRHRWVLEIAGAEGRLFEERDQGRTGIGLQTTTTTLALSDLTKLVETMQRRRALPLGLRLAKSQCFERRVTLPSAAREGFARILSLDIERATPFRRDDVYDAFVEDKAAPAAKGQTALRHIVVKRTLIDEAKSALARNGITVAFADCWNDAGEAPLALDFLASADAGAVAPRPRQTLNRLLALVAIGLVSASGYIAISKREAALAALDLQLASARAHAQALRDHIAKAEKTFEGAAELARLTARTPNPSAIIEDLTRILPDGTYLTELEIKDGRVAMAGLSGKASALVALIEDSPVFEGAEMTAPVMLDANSGKDQFRLSAHLTAAKLAQSDAQHGTPPSDAPGKALP